MIQKSQLLALISRDILETTGMLLPRYCLINKYLESDVCSLSLPQKDFCLQAVGIQIFVNFFYSVYMVSLTGAQNTMDRKEQQAHLKYVNSYIIEGYKALWGYKKQERSMWGRFIKNFQSVKENNVFDNDIEVITNLLKEYAESAITDKDERDLAMHYQIEKGSNPRELLKLDGITFEKEYERYEQFEVIFGRMRNCITEILNHYLVQKKMEELKKYELSLPPLPTLEQFTLKSKISEMNESMTVIIASQSKIFSKCKKKLLKRSRTYKDTQEKSNKKFLDSYEMIATLEAMLAISYMSLDLCSTLKFYFNSSIPLAQAIALSRMNIICYSIIDRVYGYGSRDGSYWERYLIKPFIGKNPPHVLLEIRDIMETCINNGLYTRDKRLAFVHLKKENSISAIKILYTQDPLKEIENSMMIFEVLPKIQNTISKRFANDVDYKISISGKYQKECTNILRIWQQTKIALREKYN